jgi:hypothetical protein
MKAEIWNKIHPLPQTRVKAVWLWNGNKVTEENILYEGQTEDGKKVVFNTENSSRDRYIIPIVSLLYIKPFDQ